jgi:uncharacterized membrane protein YfhO
VHSPQSALLETPRMFVPGYKATVNGAAVPVRRTSEGLVAFSIPRGESRVVLRFVGSLTLRVAFWLSTAAWVLLFAFLLTHFLGDLRVAFRNTNS